MRGLHRSVDVMCSVSGCLAQFLLFSFSFISFTCSVSWWPGCSQWGGLRSLFVAVVLIFPVLVGSWAALALQQAAPKVCVLSFGVYWDLEESSIFLRLTW